MSALPVFYEDVLLQPGKELPLSEDTARHVVQVLRMAVGQQLQLANGKGFAAVAAITETGKKKCTVHIEAVQEIPLPAPALHLGIAFTKNAARNEWLLEKATEMGVQRIVPLITARSERERFRFDRWNNILVSAMIQSQQYWLPVLEAPVPPDVLLEQSFEGTCCIAHCMDDLPKAPLKEVLQPGRDTLLLIGPEGDFTAAEVTLAMQRGAAGISLGTTRLRTETAAMAAIAFFHLWNDVQA